MSIGVELDKHSHKLGLRVHSVGHFETAGSEDDNHWFVEDIAGGDMECIIQWVVFFVHLGFDNILEMADFVAVGNSADDYR